MNLRWNSREENVLEGNQATLDRGMARKELAEDSSFHPKETEDRFGDGKGQLNAEVDRCVEVRTGETVRLAAPSSQDVIRNP